MPKANKKHIILKMGFLGISAVIAGTVLSIPYFEQKQDTIRRPKVKLLQNAANNSTIIQALAAPAIPTAAGAEVYSKTKLDAVKGKLINNFINIFWNKLKSRNGLSQITKEDVKSWFDTDNAKLIENKAMNQNYFGKNSKEVYPYKAFILGMPIKFSSITIKVNTILYISFASSGGSSTNDKNLLMDQIGKDLKADPKGAWNINSLQAKTHKVFKNIDELQTKIISALNGISNQKNTIDKNKYPTLLGNIQEYNDQMKTLQASLKQDFINQQINNVKWVKRFLKISYKSNSSIPNVIKSNLKLTINDSKFDNALKDNFIHLDSDNETVGALITKLKASQFKQNASGTGSFQSSKMDETIVLKLDGSKLDGAIKYQYTDIENNKSSDIAISVNNTSKVKFSLFKDHNMILKRLKEGMTTKLDMPNDYKNIGLSTIKKTLYKKVINKIIVSLEYVYSHDYNQETERPYELKYIIPTSGKKTIEITKNSASNLNAIITNILSFEQNSPIGNLVKNAGDLNFEFKGSYQAVVNASTDSKQAIQGNTIVERINLADSIDVISSGHGLKFGINTAIQTYMAKMAKIRNIFNLEIADDLSQQKTSGKFEDANLKAKLIAAWNQEFPLQLATKVIIKNRALNDWSVGSWVNMDVDIQDKNNVLLHSFGNVWTKTETGNSFISFPHPNQDHPVLTWNNGHGKNHSFRLDQQSTFGTRPAYFDLSKRYKLFNIQYNQSSIIYTSIFHKKNKPNGWDQDFKTEAIDDFYSKRTGALSGGMSDDEGWFVLDALTGEVQLLWSQDSLTNTAKIELDAKVKNKWKLTNGNVIKEFSITHGNNGPRGRMVIKIT